jgi:hypothetical protein
VCVFSVMLICSKFVLLQPITLALVYVGTTLKDLSDVTHGWSEFSKTRWVRASHLFFLFFVLLIIFKSDLSLEWFTETKGLKGFCYGLIVFR